MPEHTPGPLEARKGDVLNPDRTYGVVKLLSRETCRMIDGDESAYGQRTEIVAEVCAADNGTDKADAILFAAAPDLLEACEKAQHRFAEQNGNVSEEVWNANYEAEDALDAAIKKAKGGSHAH